MLPLKSISITKYLDFKREFENIFIRTRQVQLWTLSREEPIYRLNMNPAIDKPDSDFSKSKKTILCTLNLPESVS